MLVDPFVDLSLVVFLRDELSIDTGFKKQYCTALRGRRIANLSNLDDIRRYPERNCNEERGMDTTRQGRKGVCKISKSAEMKLMSRDHT